VIWQACVDDITEVIVVSDGSTDDTAETATAAGADVVIQLPKNLGKGGAVLAGVRRASEAVVLLLDADLEHLKPSELQTLLNPVLRGRYDMAVGLLTADLVQKVLPQLSGIRVLRRDALLDKHYLACTRFGFERALTRWQTTTLGDCPCPVHGREALQKGGKVRPRPGLSAQGLHGA
jgi:glycosyltransferase involved in cell wall biosynthesis